MLQSLMLREPLLVRCLQCDLVHCRIRDPFLCHSLAVIVRLVMGTVIRTLCLLLLEFVTGLLTTSVLRVSFVIMERSAGRFSRCL